MRLELDVDGAEWPKVLNLLRDDSRDYWEQDQFEILNPTPELVSNGDDQYSYNNASYVIRVRHATSTILIAGDVEEQAWIDMIESALKLRSNVLIASHHGR